MRRYKLGISRLLWLAVAVILIVLVVGFEIQRIYSAPQTATTGLSYQQAVNQIESEGYSQQEAQYIASANISTLSSNSTYSDLMIVFPSGDSAEMITTAQPVQNFTPSPNALSNATDGMYIANFSVVNDTSTGSIISNLTYYVQNSTFNSVTTSGAAGMIASFLSSSASLSVLRAGSNGRHHARPEGIIPRVLEIKSILKTTRNSWKDIQKAVEIDDQYTKWSQKLDQLETCAMNPTNPVTINGYQQDPGQKQRIINQIESSKLQLAELTIMRFVNAAIGEGAKLVSVKLIGYIAKYVNSYSDATLKGLSQELVDEIVKLVTPCMPTSQWTGKFQWDMNNGQGYDTSGSGTFVFTANPNMFQNTPSVLGNGSGEIKITINEEGCTGGGSGSYNFNVTGSGGNGTLFRLFFLPPKPATISVTQSCPNAGTTTEPTGFNSINPPIEVAIQDTSGATFQCSSSDGCSSGNTLSVTISRVGS